jgi:TonB family protein
MKLVRLSSVVILLALAHGAWADCVRPQASFDVPDGKTANAEQMAATQKQVVAYADAVTKYVSCLQGELGQKSIGKSDAEKAELNKQYAEAHNEAADQVSGLASCFNEQLDAFKASGGGTQMRAVDCKAHIASAGERASTAPGAEQMVIESSGHRFDVASGSWLYLLARDQAARPCGANNLQCFYRAVIVVNESDETLECKGQITYDGTDLDGKKQTQSQALVTPRSSQLVAGSLAKDDISASLFDAVCNVRAKLPPLDTAANCKYEVVKPVAIGDYYPPASRQAGEQGPVTVEFTVAGKAANPTNVRAVASSLYPALDQAAVKAVSDMVMSSNCPKARYRLKLSFKLD